ncbi:GlcG/HbpS family heme-binding protein [Chenggangzhangella methanolivorans]|uniref:Heme-binding protein n=1 Tax=Chenggangzhangella methanolivorans TaxID=1437009 RepID=A0A9E6R9K6_9HYPH|nr:heme-binding protein [Chenggangzhangella methanolivorans]QZO00701.1 heme-binding protein [Chenggangzhangella methanolivorans]
MTEAAFTRPRLALTHAAALRMIAAASQKAEEIGAPQNVSIVDEGGNLIAFLRTDGAKLLSRETSLAKAVTAASHRQPTGRFNAEMEPRLASATGGRLTNLAGGLPILFDGQCVGGIGVGSGLPDQDVEVARAGLAAIGADAV